MIPKLATRGILIAISGLLFLLVGAVRVAPPIVAMAGVVLGLLLAAYLAFFPTAILLRRRKIELSWWVPPGDQPGGALTADRPFALHLAFRNHGSRTLRVLRTQILASSGLDIPERPSATVTPGRQVEVATCVRASSAGYHVLHGAVIGLGDWLGLFEVDAYFPNPISIKVFPRSVPARHQPLGMALGAAQQQVGVHTVRRRGQAGDLRELREHAHGDPFKFIAWKATARRGKLMVRELETEMVSTQAIVLDVGATMRVGPAGKAPIDWAIDAVSAMARAATGAGDRIGLVAFDTRPVSALPYGTGHHHWLQLVERLLDCRSIVDEDLTDVTGGELVALVARYLAHQEGMDVRLRVVPPIDDPRWNAIQAGPDGQLYDLAAAGKLVDKLIETMNRDAKRARAGGPPTWWWNRGATKARPGVDPQLEHLRQFCRLRGIELPYRHLVEHGRRTAGLAAALERAVDGGRPDALVIVSDLVGLADDEVAMRRALGRARRSAGQLAVVVPAPARFLPAADSDVGDRVRAVVIRDAAEAQAAARTLLRRHAVPIIDAGPGDSPTALLAQLRRAPRTRAG